MKKIFMTGMLAAIILSCETGMTQQDSPPDIAALQAEFRNRKTAWEMLQIDHYRFSAGVSRPNDGGVSLNITIFPDKEPEVTSFHELPPSLINNPEWKKNPFYPSFQGNTIGDIHMWIEEDLIRLASLENPRLRVTIVYNEKYHFVEKYHEVRPPPDEGLGPAPGGTPYTSFEITWFEDLGAIK